MPAPPKDTRGDRPAAERRVAVVHLGPDPETGGGMPAVLRDLLTSPLRDRYRLFAIPTYRTADPRARLLLFARALGRLAVWCLRPGPRIVHVHTAVRGSLYRKAACVAVAKLLRRPVILHVHAGEGDIRDFAEAIGPLRRAAFTRTFALADRVLSVSAAGGAEIGRRFGVRDIVVVPNAAPRVGGVPPLPAAEDPAVPVGVLYLGGFHDPAKGGAVLAGAVGPILAAEPRARLVLAGPGTPPADLPAPNGRLEWLGWLGPEAKAAAFRATDVFVLPSISEGLPVALLEAMAYGRAIVATRVGGMPEILTDGTDALLVDPADSTALRDAVLALVRDPERRRALGSAARARAGRLNDQEVGARLERLYADLAAG